MTKATPEQMAQTMIANLREKTGKTLEEWLPILKKSGLQKHGELVKHLKGEFGVSHGYASLLARSALTKGDDISGAQLVTGQYGGAKAVLKPIYDRLVAIAISLGSDVEISPKKTYVSLRRNKQFAIIQPSTRTRVDLGINLKGEAATGKLENSGSFNAMVSHRVRLSSVDEVDKGVETWLRKAYEAA